MTKYTQTQLRSLCAEGAATEITRITQSEYQELMNREGHLTQIGYCSGTYGCNGALFLGDKTGELYAITKRSAALSIFT